MLYNHVVTAAGWSLRGSMGVAVGVVVGSALCPGGGTEKKRWQIESKNFTHSYLLHN
jgi:hypothetical protein